MAACYRHAAGFATLDASPLTVRQIPMAARFTHVTFKVSNFERSITFYRDLCDMVVVRDRRLEGGQTVWLGPKGSNAERPPFVFVIEEGQVTDRLDHLAFQCDSRADLDAKAEQARAVGALHTPPKDVGGSIGAYTLLRDPDGHLIELTYGQPIAGIR